MCLIVGGATNMHGCSQSLNTSLREAVIPTVTCYNLHQRLRTRLGSNIGQEQIRGPHSVGAWNGSRFVAGYSGSICRGISCPFMVHTLAQMAASPG
jgi:hypothetical protein